jgi:hypothetical protein
MVFRPRFTTGLAFSICEHAGISANVKGDFKG